MRGFSPPESSFEGSRLLRSRPAKLFEPFSSKLTRVLRFIYNGVLMRRGLTAVVLMWMGTSLCLSNAQSPPPQADKGRAFGSPLARGLYPRASTAEVDPQAKPGAPAAVAELAVVNGTVFTLDPERPLAEAVAVKDGKILAVGDASEIKRFIGSATTVLDVKGRLVIPGLIDAHVHLVEGGRSLAGLSFRGVTSMERILDRIASTIGVSAPGETIEAGQFDHTLWPGQKWPIRNDLDTIAPGNAVVILHVDGQSVWVNSEALRQSGITKETPSPFGGEIVKDPATGEPTGILKGAAMGLLKVKPPSRAPAPKDDIERGLRYAARLGLTGVHTSASLEELELYKQLQAEGKLTLRVYAWLSIADFETCLRRKIKQGQGDEWLKVGFQKLFLDGSLRSGTAFLFEPFADDPLKIGLPQYRENAYAALIARAHKNGYQTATHAVGDQAVNWALNAIEQAEKAFGKKDLRHRIEHAEVIRPADIARFKPLGVVASMQPIRTTADIRVGEARLGRDRSAQASVWRTLLEADAKIAFGSDWPIEPLDPMRGLYSAVTRKNIELGIPPGGWFPGQKLAVGEAVELFTLGSAYASFEENIKGSLEPGKWADLTVLAKDIFKTDAREILTTEIFATIVGGRIVYRR
jgi:predicted amidohydrolase YtcJ